MPIFCVKSVKIYTGQKNLHGRRPWRPLQIWGMKENSENASSHPEIAGISTSKTMRSQLWKPSWVSTSGFSWISTFKYNISKSITDPGVEFISKNLHKSWTNFNWKNISISTKVKLKIFSKPIFIILTKTQVLNLNQTSILTKLQLQNLDQKLCWKSNKSLA